MSSSVVRGNYESNISEDNAAEECVDWVEEGVDEDEAKIALGMVGRIWTSRNINANAVISTMRRLWSPRHGMEANCIGDKLFFFQFHHWRGKKTVMDNQPWHFDHHVLALDDVHGTLSPSEMPLHKVPFRVRIYDLPLKGRQNINNAKVLGDKIGEFVELDTRDVVGINKSMRIRVKVDVGQALKSTVELRLKGGEIKTYPVKYEKLPVFCYICGMFGHGEKDCEEGGDGCVERAFNENLRTNTPWRVNKGEGASNGGTKSGVAKQLFVMRKREEVSKEEVSKLMKEVTETLNDVSLNKMTGKVGRKSALRVLKQACRVDP